MDHERDIALPCPNCEIYAPIYDHQPMRTWRHLNTCQFPTYIHLRPPRVRCSTCGVKQVLSDFSEPGSDKTMAFESFVIALEKECSLEAVSRLTGLKWDAAFGVMERAVRRGISRKEKRIPAHIGVDEKSFRKGHRYETLVYDTEKATVEYVADERRVESLAAYYRQFTKEEKSKVESVSMDMWEPFIKATCEGIPGGRKKIVFDKFHVMRYILTAVDDVRKAEHHALQNAGDATLKGTRYLWLWNKVNIPPYRKREFRALRKLNLKVGRAWAMKENFQHFWKYKNEKSARTFFNRWYFWATHSHLKPMVKAAKTIKSHFENIVTYLKLKVTNAVAEGLNNKIERVKRMACGFRNRANYRMAIMFHCGGLDLEPRGIHFP